MVKLKTKYKILSIVATCDNIKANNVDKCGCDETSIVREIRIFIESIIILYITPHAVLLI
jgi:hypothetical protein